jgi:phosphoadenosine phosphosulfate reductase
MIMISGNQKNIFTGLWAGPHAQAGPGGLGDKLDTALDGLCGLAREHGPENVRVAWTGGKDSTLVLDLWARTLAGLGLGRPRALFVDTGVKFPQVLAFMEAMAGRLDVDLHVAAADVEEEYQVAGDKTDCCRRLKIEPLRAALTVTQTRVLLTGIRGDEHPDRAARSHIETRTDPDHLQANPILDFTEMDVWSATWSRGLAYCELYDAGYRSLGCRPCTRHPGGGERSGRDPDKEAVMAGLRALGYF